MLAPRQIAERLPASFMLCVKQICAAPERHDAGFHLSVAIAAGLFWLVLALH